MAANPTIYCLEQLTDYLAFERLSHDLMNLQGYKNIEPLGGFNDKGRDAIHVDESNKTTIFAYSVREDWRAKLAEDVNKIEKHGHSCDKLVFVTTSKISAGKRDEAIQSIKNEYGWELDIYSQERLRILLEVEYPTLKVNHPQIFTPDLFPDVTNKITGKGKIVIIFDKEDVVFTEWLIRKLTFEGYEICTPNYSISGTPVRGNLRKLIQEDAAGAIAILSNNALNSTEIIQQITVLSELEDRFIQIDLEKNLRSAINKLVNEPSIISFYTDWAKGLGMLLEFLEEKEIPKNLTDGANIALKSFINDEVVSAKPEQLYSNTLRFTLIPDSLLLVKTKKKIPNSTYNNIKNKWAVRGVDSTTYLSFFHPLDSIVEKYGLTNIELVKWRNRKEVLRINTKHLISELLYKSLYRKCIFCGLKQCDKSNLYFFPSGLTEKDKIHFTRPNGSKSYIKYHGKRHYPTSNGPTPYEYYLAPQFKVYQNLYDDFVGLLNIRYRFTDTQGRPLEGQSVNSRRKHLTQNWWNKQWFSRLIAICQFLSDGDSIVIEDIKDEYRKVLLDATPANLRAPIGINEEILGNYPTDRTYLKTNKLAKPT